MKQGLITFKSNSAMVEEETTQILEEIRAEESRKNEQAEIDIAAYIRRKWETAKRHKEPIEKRMIENLRQLEGRYSTEKEQEIVSQGLPLIYMRITAVKCRAAKSWVRDVLMPAGD